MQLPVLPQKGTRKKEELTVFLIRSGSRTAVRKRPGRGLLAGLYEFPSAQGHLSMEEAVRFLLQKDIPALRLKPLPDAKHIFTHKEWIMTGYEVAADVSEEKKIPFLLASEEELRDRYSVPSAFGVYLKYLFEHPADS